MFAAILSVALTVAGNPLDSPPVFRVDTEIVVGTKKIQRSTIFDGDFIIDFDPTQAATEGRYIVYDLSLTRIISVDPPNKQQAPIACADLERMLNELVVGLNSAQLASFGFNATVDREREGLLHVATDSFSYEVAAQREPVTGVAVQYATFASWAARVNVLERRGSPPFARIKLNETLALNSEVPESIRLTRTAGGDATTIHRFSTSLTLEDQQRIRQAHQQLDQFSVVAWDVH